MCEETKPETMILCVHESVAQSWAKDTFTFGGMILVPLFTHRMGIGSWVLDGIIVIMLLAFLLSKAAQSKAFRKKTPRQALAWLAENFPELYEPGEGFPGEPTDIYEALARRIGGDENWDAKLSDNVKGVKRIDAYREADRLISAARERRLKATVAQ